MSSWWRRTLRTSAGGRVVRAAVVVWLGAFGLYLSRKGIPYTTDDVVIWLFALLLALSLGDWRRSGPRVIRDWLPLFGILIVYNLLRGYATTTGWTPHYSLQVELDKWIGGGQVLSVRLQRWLWNPRHLHVWDYAALFVYLSHFVASFIVAAVLWKRNYLRFCRFMWMYLTLTFFGFVTFVLFPAQPPWMAAGFGHLPPLTRIIPVTLDHAKLHLAAAVILKGSAYANPVASIPSLHAAYPILMTLVFWKSARWWLRVVLIAYPLAMAFTLVYSAEHFVIDIGAGWLYAVAVYLVLTPIFDWWQFTEPSTELHPVALGRPAPSVVAIGSARSTRRPA